MLWIARKTQLVAYQVLSLFIVSLIIQMPSATAQVYTWDGGGGTGSWNDALNWVGDTVPVSAANTSIILAGTLHTATTQSIVHPFLLNNLTFAASAGTFSISGNSLQFMPDGMVLPTILLQASNYSLINSSLILTADVTIGGTTSGTGGAGYDLIFNGNLTGAGGLKINFSSSTVGAVLKSRWNSFSGETVITNGRLWLGAVNAISRDSAVTVDGALRLNPTVTERGVSAGSYDQRIGSLSGAATGVVSLGSATLTAGFDSSFTTFAGVIQGTGGLSKVGYGSLTMMGANTFTGRTNIEDGILSLTGINGQLASSFMSLAQNSSLYLDNISDNNNNRLPNTTTLHMRGGAVILFGNNSVPTHEAVGDIILESGQSYIDITPGSATGASLTSNQLSTVTGTVIFFGNNLGATPGPDISNVYFVTPPTFVNNVLPPALASGSNTGDTYALVTYDTHGIRPFHTTDYAPNLLTASATQSVRQTANVTVSSSITRNALAFVGDGLTLTVDAGQTITLTAGAFILLPGTGPLTVNGTGQIAFGTGGTAPAYVTVEGGDGNFHTPLLTSALIKSGNGTLILHNTATLGSANVYVNGGNLVVTGSAPLASTPIIALSATTLDVSAVTGFILNSSQLLTGDGTVSGNMIVAGTLEPSSRPGPGTLIVDSMVWYGGGTFVWSLNSDTEGAYTQSLIYGSGVLDLTSPTLHAGNRFTISLKSLKADNSLGTVSDYDPNASYLWPIATFDGGINGFHPDKFTIDSTQFASVNDLAGGTFNITQIGNSLYLSFTPIPESTSTIGLWGLGLLAWARLRQRLFVVGHKPSENEPFR